MDTDACPFVVGVVVVVVPSVVLFWNGKSWGEWG